MNFEPRHKDMQRHMVSGVLSSGAVQIIKVLCQFGSVVVLSRMLEPSDFGIMAMVGPIYAFTTLFQNLGLSQATIQKPTLTHEEANIVFWVNTGLGLLLAIMMGLLSPLVGLYYNDPRVTPLMIAMSALLFVGALGNQHGTIMQRRMEFGALSLIDAIGTVGTLVATIIFAFFYKSYWALYFGVAVGHVIPVVGTWIAAGWRPSLPRRVPGLGNMLKFGAGMTGYNIANFLARNLDNVLIGRRWGDEILGFYDRAYKLMLFPLQRMVMPFGGVMVPLLSRIIDQPDEYKSTFLKTLRQISLLTWPGILWAFALADTLIPILLGPKWGHATSIFKPLALVGLVQIINSTANWLFVSQGRAGAYARWGIFNASSSIAAFVIGLPYGADGVAIAYAVSEIIGTPLLWWYVTRRGPVSAVHIGKALLPQAAGSIIAIMALFGLHQILGDASKWGLLISGGLLSYGVFVLVMLFFADGRETLKQALMFVRRSITHVTLRGEAKPQG